MISVFIVDDSETARRALRLALEKSPQLTVVGEAATPEAAMRLIPRLGPQLVTMDVCLGHSDGVQLTEWIMAESPRPVIIVTGINPTDPDLAYRALKAGALEVVGKLPAPNRPDYPTLHRQLVRLVTNLAAVPVVSRSRRNRGRTERRAPSASPPTVPGTKNLAAPPSRLGGGTDTTGLRPRAVVVGASTGGPPALAELLGSISAPLSLPIIIVQHIGEGFGEGFAKWLGDVTPHEVVLVNAPQELLPGRIYVADGNRHVKLTDARRVGPDDGPPVVVRPSADILFRSAAMHLGQAVVGVLLTGMGSDGTAGFGVLKKAGATTIVQSPDTCVVGGMPQAAIDAGVVDRVGSLAEVGRWLGMASRAHGAPERP